MLDDSKQGEKIRVSSLITVEGKMTARKQHILSIARHY